MVRLARPRSGHFDLGTGYHGDLWLDLDALFLRPSRLRSHVRWLGERSGAQKAAPTKLGSRRYKALAKAPGSYVHAG